jgi:outer membrane protein OmpA-like peptidoglycan-associated protein
MQSTYRLHVTAPDFFTIDKLIMDLSATDTIDLQPIEKQKAIVLNNLYFASFQTTILPESEAALQQLYEMLAGNPELRIRIVGHTDDVGTDEDNQVLSEGRAKSVRQAMIDRGIDPARIEAEGRGEKEPVVPNTSDENRAKNRRVEFVIL